ncbi:MAG: DUF4935 domain-containing protein, partial [Simkaniaceae bacterium]|nr:DUF4935 domain-containing protein [Simkaniaceae bacterium]
MKDKYNTKDNFIILDTNIYIQDFLLRGKSFKILLEGLEKINGIIILPVVVFEELIVKYNELIEEKYDKFKTSLKNLNKQSINDLEISVPKELVTREIKTYRRHIQNIIDSGRFKLVDTPDVKHEEIINR